MYSPAYCLNPSLSSSPLTSTLSVGDTVGFSAVVVVVDFRVVDDVFETVVCLVVVGL